MSEWLCDESMPPDIPDSDEIQADLCASPYDRDSNDRRVLWSKDKIKSKYGFSPDYGDAAALTFAEPIRVDNIDLSKLHISSVNNWCVDERYTRNINGF